MKTKEEDALPPRPTPPRNLIYNEIYGQVIFNRLYKARETKRLKFIILVKKYFGYAGISMFRCLLSKY